MAGKKITQLNSGSISNLPLSGVTAVVYSGTTFQHSLSNLRQILVDSGSHNFTGSQVINGNLTISGSITAQQYILSSSITNITTETISGSSNFGNSSDDIHTFTGSVNITGSLTSNNLIVGPISEILSGSQYTAAHIATSNSINIAHFEGNDIYYSQINITNTNSGNNASTDLVLTADNGTENVHYVDLGINSSTYTGGLVGYANDSYLLNVGKDLYIGTVGGINHPAKLHLFAENNWETPQITIHTGSQITFNTSSFTEGYSYEFSGSVKLKDELKVDGSVTASYFVGDGSHLTNLPVQSTDVSMFLSSSTFNTFTSSYNITSASFDSRITAATNEQDLSYFATTGSNTFIGNQILTGSIYMGTGSIILPNGTEIYDTGDSGFGTTGIGLGNNGFNIDFGSNANDWALFQNANLIQMQPTNQFGIVITSEPEYGWFFNGSGMSFPDGTIQTTAYPGPIDTGSFATTGSNTFNGNQIINGTITLDNNSVIKDTANQSISFGVDSAVSGQGTQSTAIGSNAGQTDQGNGATALGALAGNLTQGQSAVAIGALAGSTLQGEWAIAIGTQAGGINQGNYSIALGNLAGGLNQAQNSIVINATGTQLDNTTTSSLKIAPIRNVVGNSGVLQYNTTTKEVSYSDNIVGSFSGSLDYSYLINVPTLVSQSSQISYTGITDVPSDLVSGSSQISNLGFATTGSNTFIGDQTINGSLIIEGVSEVITVDGGFNGNRTFDYTSGSIFYLTGLTGNGVWDVQNVPTTNNRGLTLTYVIEQGSTAYSGSQYQINGSNVTVKWVDNTIPTGSANNTEVIGLTAFRVGSSWNVIGSLSTFGI